MKVVTSAVDPIVCVDKKFIVAFVLDGQGLHVRDIIAPTICKQDILLHVLVNDGTLSLERVWIFICQHVLIPGQVIT